MGSTNFLGGVEVERPGVLEVAFRGGGGWGGVGLESVRVRCSGGLGVEASPFPLMKFLIGALQERGGPSAPTAIMARPSFQRGS